MGRLTRSLCDNRPKEHAYDMIARQQPDTTFHHTRRPTRNPRSKQPPAAVAALIRDGPWLDCDKN